MRFSVKVTKPESIITPCLVLPVFEGSALPKLTQQIDIASGKAVSKLIKAGDINGKVGETLLLQKLLGVKAQRVLLIGCGSGKDIDAKKYNKIIKASFKFLQQHNLSEFSYGLTTLPVSDLDTVRKAELLARDFVAQQYKYTTTLSKKTPSPQIKHVVVMLEAAKDRNPTNTGLATGKAIGEGMNIAKELGNLPGNFCTPTFLGQQAKLLASKNKLLSTQVLTEAQMKRLGMHSLLSVGNGSKEDSALIVMQYRGAPASEKPQVLVGKGITFDTGGISLKGGAAMDEMKYDMCGAASVMGVMNALCQLKPKINVVGVIASAENMPSSTATKPGDVVTSMSKQTIEVLNTDAEGRLVLCDALTYVERFKPKTVIDIATLTGACIVALGSVASGLMSNDDKLAATLYDCGQTSLDPVWRLPIWDEYQTQLKSNFADIANIGGPKAGSITAACFLARFTKKYRWAHLDIAGTAWLQGAQKGATGRPVPLLMEYLLKH